MSFTVRAVKVSLNDANTYFCLVSTLAELMVVLGASPRVCQQAV
jgi:hypothetical protein